MELFRLARKAYANDFSGKGAAINGGRWNSAGVPMLYLSPNRSLAMAEVAVHFTWATLPLDYQMLTLWLPDNTPLTSLAMTALPADWHVFPHPQSTQKLGNKFVTAGKFCLLKVPSAVTKGDHNVIMNPKHPSANQLVHLATEPFPFDSRFFTTAPTQPLAG